MSIEAAMSRISQIQAMLSAGMVPTPTPAPALKTSVIIASTSSNTWFSFTKLISMSICVCSGWRSARRSSSRMQRAI